MIVGLGASAGGIAALQAFFQNTPADSGAAYVVILHLSPDHDSQLAQVLQATATIPVMQVTQRIVVEANRVYVIPPDQHLSMVGAQLVVERNTTIAERRAPVDIFFRTLAESHRTRAICVVLSGTGANGSMGLKRVKEMGGAAFVQDPREAEFDEMPRNSIGTRLVDDVLPVTQIPARIAQYIANLDKVRIALQVDHRPANDQGALREIFLHLRARTGHDFSNYKRPTLLRRIERRVHVHGLPDLPAYAELMRHRAEESQALLKDILISVTNFFRDAQAFEHVQKEILPQILRHKRPLDVVRIWVIGCATGEEAYSFAMLCAEQTVGVADAPKVQIFASDIDATALAHAREGLYTLNDAADVSPERLRRFFTNEGDEYRIRREVREMVLFANQNVINDPPFSHLDLVSCRNVLIYLDAQAQERVLETAHFALHPGGYLLLGSSESIGEASDLFATVGRHEHVFQARNVAYRRFPLVDRVPEIVTRTASPVQRSDEPRRESPRATFGDLHLLLLEQYAPPSVVVNDDYDIIHLSPRVGRYLQIGGGEPTKNLPQLVHPELRLELRGALYQATSARTSVVVRDLTVVIDNRPERVNIHVRPVTSPTDTARGFILVVFEPSQQQNDSVEKVIARDEPVARQLEEELIRLKQQLRSTNEAHEAQAEELKASNEELQAMNEELRSAAEELETSREELQSINEELTTVNQELKVKIEEVLESSNNLRNLINSTNIATVFLNRTGHVHLFSPASRAVFNLLPSDIGRPLSDITTRLIDTNLVDDATQVLATLSSVEREVRTTDARSYLMRLLPYRTSDDRIQGVVATFTDITDRKRAEEAIAADLHDTSLLREVGARLTQQGDIQVPYQDIVGAAVRIARADSGILHMLDPTTGALMTIAAHGLDSEFNNGGGGAPELPVPGSERALASRERMFTDVDVDAYADDDSRRFIAAGYRSILSTPLLTRSGRPLGLLSTFWRRSHRPIERELRFIDLLARQAADFIAQRQSAEELAESQQRLMAITNLVPDLLWSSDASGRSDWYNRRWYEYTGQSPGPAFGFSWFDALHPEDQAASREQFDAAMRSGEPLRLELRLRNADGEYRWFLIHTVAFRDESGTILRWYGAAIDIHERRLATEALRASEERLRLTLESVVDYAIFTTNADGVIDSWNTGAQRMFGYAEREALGLDVAVIFTPEDRAAGAHLSEMRTARETGRAMDERWHIRKDGSRFYVSGVLTSLRDDNGNLRGYTKVARDLTEHKTATDSLQRAHEELELKVDERTRELADANVSLREEITERERAEEVRLALIRQLVDAQEGERRRISRELHDQLGQEVSAMSLKLSMLKREVRDATVRAQLESLEGLAKKIDGDLDFLVWELRPTALDDLGLIEALEDYIESWSAHFSIPATFDAEGMEGYRLPPEIETVIYRIAQEALNNISKHAQASNVQMHLDRGNEIAFTIADDGIGFDPQHPFGTGAKGLGLVSMRERASLIGGSVDIQSKPGQGTMIIVRVPLIPTVKATRTGAKRKAKTK